MKIPPRFRLVIALLGVLSVSCFPRTAGAAEPVSLMTAGKPALGWSSNYGGEFPGATVKLAIDPAAQHEGNDSLKLEGDFTKGGAYVQAMRPINDVDIRELSMWLRSPDTNRLTVRIIDSTGQCHQIDFKIKEDPEWQRLVLPIDQFFDKTEAEGATPVAKYEYWGGAKDGKWHGPAKAICLVIGKSGENKIVDLWVSGVAIIPKPKVASAGTVTTSTPIAEIIEGETDWGFDNGREFPGAKGSLAVVKDQPAPGQACMELTGDFSGGGNYVQCRKDLASMDLGGDIAQIRMKVRTDSVRQMTVRLNDSTGQCHQAKFPVVADGQWHDVVLKPKEIAGGEHWGGSNDGKWHGPATSLAMILGPQSEDRSKPLVIDFADIQADVLSEAVVQASSFKSDFEKIDKIPDGWKTEGSVSIDTKEAFKGTQSLLFDRPPDKADLPCSAVSPAFAANAGTWDVALACKSDLQSPDNSFDGVVTIEALDASGNVIAPAATLADIFGPHNWQPIAKRLELPKGTVSARFRVVINKAVGQFRVDEISASFLAAAPRKDERINRLVLFTSQLGNLIYPEDPRVVTANLETTRPLDPGQTTLSYHLRDYWGAELTTPETINLTRVAGKNGAGRFVYQGSIDLSKAPMEVGRYYELHAEVPRPNSEPFHDRTMLAILPEAVANSYKPEEIPFSSRDWDSRLTEYFYLSHRLGIRICNIWSGWSADPPYKASAPSIDICEKLGMGVIAGTPVHAIEYHEAGWQKYDEKALREGVRNLITTYANRVHPFIIDLGNEPHGTGPGVIDNVKAYQYVYEGAKATDPNIFVLGTSVGPSEEYFQDGFGKWCDAYDFHIYEDPANVGLTLRRYKKMFEQYGDAKPIWSTELGLNSQGMARHAVSIDMVKKLATFFANGGANVSWFDLLYPDKDATGVGGSSAAHDVFESRYVKYSPKLTAITYYNLINAICIKKFVAEKQYGEDVHAYLFRDRDNRELQILWKDKGRQDAFLPLPAAGEVQVVRLDGSRNTLHADGKGVTLTINEDPILLLYAGTNPLADGLEAPSASFVAPPAGIVRGAATDVVIGLNGARAEAVDMAAPPFWDVKKTTVSANGGPAVRFTLTPPTVSAIREADLTATIKDANGAPSGVLYLRPAVTGQFSVKVLPVPADAKGQPAVKVAIKNNGEKSQDLDFEVSLTGQVPLVKGDYESQKPVPSDAYFSGSPKGTVTVPGGQTVETLVPLAGVDPLNVYKTRTIVSDQTGRSITRERNVAGFVAVPRATGAINADGVLDEADWQQAPAQKIDQQRQFYAIDKQAAPWEGPADLSGTVRFLWDDKYLYVGVKVTQAVTGGLQQDSNLWAQSGLQFLIDPCRSMDESIGKYDYTVAVGKKGPQAWCALTADAGAPNGEVKDFIIGTKPAGDGSGSITYEVAIPWSRLAPFKPEAGGDLGLTMILNEDKGAGRHSFMTWFGNAHTKQVDTVGDLILGK